MKSVDWNLITETSIPDSSYNIFLDKLIKTYECIPKKKTWNKTKKIVKSLDYKRLEKIIKEKTTSIWKVMKT